jgi:hypothetical protein
LRGRLSGCDDHRSRWRCCNTRLVSDEVIDGVCRRLGGVNFDGGCRDPVDECVDTEVEVGSRPRDRGAEVAVTWQISAWARPVITPSRPRTDLDKKIGCPTPIAIVVLTLFVFGPYLGMVHAYSIGRLRHLVANLPRTSERITLREANSNVAAHMSSKLLCLMLACMSIGFLGSFAGLAGAYYDGHLLRQLPYLLPAIVLCGLVTVVQGKTAIGRAMRIRATP